jgi:hypothetical protein
LTAGGREVISGAVVGESGITSHKPVFSPI